MSEDLVVRYCAPTLAGIKTGNLFNCDYKSIDEVKEAIGKLEKKLRGKGVRVVPLRYSKNRVLIYIYRPSRLARDLKHKRALKILEKFGYSWNERSGFDEHIGRLIKRINKGEDFPHEIGLFLGYPPEDVEGFMKYKGSSCKCTGCWKVYGDEKKALSLFAKYKRCTRIYGEKWLQGESIQRLTVAV